MSDTYLKVFIVFYASVCSQGGKDWTLLKGWAHTWHEMPFVTSQRDDFPNVLNSLCSEKNHCEDHRTAHSVMNVSNFIFSISSDLSGSPLYVEAVGGLQHVSRVMERSLPLVTRHLSSQHVLCYGKSKSGTLWRSHSHSETMPFLCFGTKLMHVDSTWRSPRHVDQQFCVQCMWGPSRSQNWFRTLPHCFWKKQTSSYANWCWFLMSRILPMVGLSILLIADDILKKVTLEVPPTAARGSGY